MLAYEAPFRYRSYYYDSEINMYYLNSRYYDAKMHRFINADDVSYLGANGDLQAFNLYAYCSNNPVMYFDPLGNTIVFQALVSALCYVGFAIASLWDEDIKNDMDAIGWNPFNTEADVASNSTKVSFYEGVPVLQISEMGGSMSLGIIFFDKSQGVETLKHERGHNTQLMTMGLGNYLIQIGIPSLWKNGDETPWELSASMLGRSAMANGYSEIQKRRAYEYYIRARFPIINIYNILEYVSY